MIYTATITALKNGSASNPVQRHMAVTRGLLYRFELYFPPGSSGLMKIKVTDGGYPLYPSEPSEWFFGDNTVIAFDDKYFIQTPDQELTIWYYNEDDTYDHVFQVRIGQVLKEAFIASFIPGYEQKTVEEYIAELVAAQEEQKSQVTDALLEFFTGSAETVEASEE